MFREYVFPKVSALVGPGGKYEGHIPVFQGDNARPHQEDKYLKFVTKYCAERGWHWEPQAPQMSHLNVLDLSVFPVMSRHHTALAHAKGGLCVLKEDAIWEAAEEVWCDLPSSKIALGYIQAFCLAKKVMEM